VNRALEAKARGLAGLKGYTTNLTDPAPEFVIGSYHQLWRIETGKPQCCHSRGLSALSSAPSCSAFMREA
jgi:hypothetical protein